jgi:Tol biopolymer transport system component
VRIPDVLEVAWSPDSRLLAAYGTDRTGWNVTVVDVASGAATVIHRFEQGEERAEFAWSPDGARLAFRTAAPI